MELLVAAHRDVGGELVSAGGTGTASICASYPGVTEVQPGSFIFMDTDYRNAIGSTYANALTVLSTVISKPAPQTVLNSQ